MHHVLSPPCQQQRLLCPVVIFPTKMLIIPCIVLWKNIFVQKYTLSNAPFKSIPTGHLQILTHLSTCFTFFLTLIACAFLPHWLRATVIRHLALKEQDFWDRNIFLVTKVTSYEKVLFSGPFLLS